MSEGDKTDYLEVKQESLFLANLKDVRPQSGDHGRAQSLLKYAGMFVRRFLGGSEAFFVLAANPNISSLRSLSSVMVFAS